MDSKDAQIFIFRLDSVIDMMRRSVAGNCHIAVNIRQTAIWLKEMIEKDWRSLEKEDTQRFVRRIENKTVEYFQKIYG